MVRCLGPGRLIWESHITFILVFAVFATAIDPRSRGRLAPLAMGLTVLVNHLVSVRITGTSMNLALSLGPALFAGEWEAH
jgi:aquaporin Z